MDVIEVLHPSMHLVLEVDHSTGHAKYGKDRLHVTHMNVNYGGKQKVARDSDIIEECLGEGEAPMHLNSGTWSGKFMEGKTTNTVDFNLEVRETQNMTCPTDALPPFYDCQAPMDTKVGTKVRTTRERKRGLEEGDGAEVQRGEEGKDGSGDVEVVDVIKEGYAEKLIGMEQVMSERGRWVDGMTGSDKNPEKNI